MASIRCFPLQFPPIQSQPKISNPIKLQPLRSRHLKTHLTIRASNSIPTTEAEFLKAISESDESVLPCLRKYENDLTRLSLVGDVDFQQALTAAAADRGETAKEHLESKMSAMVVETVVPGTAGERSTISTRLFLPTEKVIEKAKRLRGSINKEMIAGVTSRDILAMTFKQVELEKLHGFELVVLNPGSERDMNESHTTRDEVEHAFTISSLDEHVLSVLAEVICKFALENTQSNFIEGILGKSFNNFLPWFWKPKKIRSTDETVVLYKLNDYAISQNAKKLLETYNLAKAEYPPLGRKINAFWAESSLHMELEKVGGIEFSSWVSEYIPAYKLQIDADRLHDVKLDGWMRSKEGNTWEVVLTHSQMVEIGNILDMYYEDVYTLPYKQLSSLISPNFTNLPKRKRNSSFLKTLSISLASGILLFTVGVLGRVYVPYIYNGRINSANNPSPVSTEVDFIRNDSVDPSKLDDLCISIVKKIKDAYGLLEEPRIEFGTGACIGEIPPYLKSFKADASSEEVSITPSHFTRSDADTSAPSVEDIASFQVVTTLEGKIVGFQPTNRVAVNHWAKNPLTKELYGGRTHTPGILEPSLNIPFPNEVALFEVLMSVNPKAKFALARPFV